MAKPTPHYGAWRIRWIDENGTRQSAVHDDRREALFQLHQRQLEVDERRRGLRPTPAEPKTFLDIAAYHEQHRAPQKRSFKDDLSILKQLRAGFGTLGLSNAAEWVPAIDRYVANKSHLNRKTVANHLTLLGSMLRLAVDLGWMPRAPRIRKPKVRLIGQDYSYLRTEAEIARFLRSAEEEGPVVAMLYESATFTGLRAGELAGLQWPDVNFEQRLITVQRSFHGPTKSDDVRYVPIVDALLPALRAWRLQHPGSLVFTNCAGSMLQPSSRIFQEVLHRVLDRAEFPRIDRGGKTRRYIHFHDLRHTFASHWVMKGGDLFKLQKILGHKTVQMTMRYAHLQPTAFKDDLGRFGAARSNGGAPVLELGGVKTR
jgi:integrase